jgi:hypothetical protein
VSVLVLLNEEDGGAAGVAWTVTVEVAFATQPMAPTPTWTDITQWVLQREGITHTWGRPDELGEVQPSTLTLTLDNADGRFTRGLSSSPYFPNVRNGRRIRVSAVRSSITYRRFDGHVNEWPTLWPAGRTTYAEATITATDRLKRFGEVGELRSMLEEEILADAEATGSGGAFYFPLSEPEGATAVGNIAPQIQNAAAVVAVGSGGPIEFGQGTGPGTDGLSAPLFTTSVATAGELLQAELATRVGANNQLTVECFFRTGSTTRTLVELATPAGTRQRLTLDSGGSLTATAVAGGTGATLLTLTSGSADNDELTHHAAYTLSISGSTVTGRLYLDGTQVDTGTYTSVTVGSYRTLRIGGQKASQLFTGTLSHVAGHSATLSAARLLAHANAGINGLAGERSDQRIGRFADYLAIPSADRAFDTGDSLVAAQATSGAQPIEAMREVERAEDGVLFISGANLLTFHKRSRRYNTTPAVTLTMAQVQQGLEFPGDDFGMVNDMSVNRAGNSQARALDQASIDEYGLYRDTLDIPAADDTTALAVAQWRVGNYGTPRTRIPNVAVELARLESIAPSQVALLLTTDISTRVRLSGLPAQAPASAVDVFVEGGTETIFPKRWRIQFNTSPADFGQVWQLAVAGFSELGTTTRLGL